MNIALLIAGGVGSRMNQNIPKQFMEVFEKPVIVYTLEKFEKHPSIDIIAVACLEGWENVLESYVEKYSIKKLKHIIKAGSTGQESIKNGLFALKEMYSKEDYIVIHDANRPMVSGDIISDCLVVAKEKGNAIACIPCQEAMLETSDMVSSNSSYPRANLKRTQTPHCFKLNDIVQIHNKAKELDITNSIASCTLAIETGETVYFSQGSEKNIKITTQDDIDIFKALLKGRNE